LAAVADDVEFLCEHCGRPADIEGDDRWLTIEIDRDKVLPLYVNFCKQDHAVDWLSQPLPPGEPTVEPPSTTKDRLIDGLLLAVPVVVLALVLLGLYTVVRWLAGWP
jgi:hypothetical protein